MKITLVLLLGLAGAGVARAVSVWGDFPAVSGAAACRAVGGALPEKDGALAPAVKADFLHLTPKGYGIYAKETEPAIRKVLAVKP